MKADSKEKEDRHEDFFFLHIFTTSFFLNKKMKWKMRNNIKLLHMIKFLKA